MDESVINSLPTGASPEHLKRLQEWKQNPAQMQEWLRQTMLLALMKDADLAQGDDKDAAEARKRLVQLGSKLLETEE